ncbi:hypothetical protein K9U39_20645 [Rhodoblastus acidophilus]|uniref:Uncharacterized protein n=1 Tax=Candidatus Rhodoblastus alkanivorans TaxID=2954117 RepID=A0ABS9ZBS5_9HYPH|nr:hypothetical protein [Candidatus Rhodoblastus alkanivorans]MCI4680626.1 hypothetical protein [Candidatus Rhodoblastus alkanivorans]MCI4685032.1 hypothetical protein [Candidatus Rhodoblastus alkanivorans]MDI4643293.1 hypothetical protein [Rhodoblastus acidophilus]
MNIKDINDLHDNVLNAVKATKRKVANGVDGTEALGSLYADIEQLLEEAPATVTSFMAEAKAGYGQELGFRRAIDRAIGMVIPDADWARMDAKALDVIGAASILDLWKKDIDEEVATALTIPYEKNAGSLAWACTPESKYTA